MVVVSGTVVAVPEVGWVPLQPPEAVQVSELADDHCRSAVLPAVTVLLAAVNVSVGAGVPLVVLPVPPLLLSEDEPPPQAARTDRTIVAIAQRARWSGGSPDPVGQRHCATRDVIFSCIPRTSRNSTAGRFNGGRRAAQTVSGRRLWDCVTQRTGCNINHHVDVIFVDVASCWRVVDVPRPS